MTRKLSQNVIITFQMPSSFIILIPTKVEGKELEKLYINFQKTAGLKKVFVTGAELVNFCKVLGLFEDLVFNAPYSLAFGLGSVGSSLFADRKEFVPPRSVLINKLGEHPDVEPFPPPPPKSNKGTDWV